MAQVSRKETFFPETPQTREPRSSDSCCNPFFGEAAKAANGDDKSRGRGVVKVTKRGPKGPSRRALEKPEASNCQSSRPEGGAPSIVPTRKSARDAKKATSVIFIFWELHTSRERRIAERNASIGAPRARTFFLFFFSLSSPPSFIRLFFPNVGGRTLVRAIDTHARGRGDHTRRFLSFVRRRVSKLFLHGTRAKRGADRPMIYVGLMPVEGNLGREILELYLLKTFLFEIVNIFLFKYSLIHNDLKICFKLKSRIYFQFNGCFLKLWNWN